MTQDCADYTVLEVMNSISTLTQEVLEGPSRASLFKLPAGPLQMALGLDTRRDLRLRLDSGYNANQDYANVVQNITLPVAVEGKTDVKEAYVEFAIPLLRDLPRSRSRARPAIGSRTTTRRQHLDVQDHGRLGGDRLGEAAVTSVPTARPT